MLRNSAVILIIAFFQFVSIAVHAAPTVSVSFSQLTGIGPFDGNDAPGNDSSATNTIIRTNDVISYRFEIAVQNDDATNIVLRVSVAAGLRMTLPPFCRTSGVSPISSITGDSTTGYAVICNVGDIGQGSQVLYSMPATVEPDRANNTTVSMLTASIESDQTALEVFPGSTSTVSAAPRLDLVKDAQTRLIGQRDGPNGESGIVYTFPILVIADNEAKGNELVTSDISFTDNLSNISPNARLYQGWSGALASACVPNRTYNSYRVWQLPYGYTNAADGGPGSGTAAGPAERSVWDSGTITCTTPAPGGTTTVTISGADLSARHAPSEGQNGRSLPADKAYLVSANLIVWIPTQDITDAGGQLSIDNVYENFTALSISNAPNVDPDLDNNRRTFVARDGNGARSFYNHIDHDSFDRLPGQTSRLSGDAQVLPGTVFATRHYQYNRAWVTKSRYNDFVFCTSFDNTKQRIFEIAGGQAAKIHTSGTFDGVQPDFTIEYGTGTFGTTATCDDADSPVWYSDITSIPGGPGAITKVRAKTDYIAPPGGNSTQVIVSLITRFETLPNAVGTILPAYGSFRSSSFNSGAWLLSQYDLNTAIGRYGDRVTVTEALVRVSKDTVPSGKTDVLAGDPVSFKLVPSITTPTASPPVTADVVLTDTLPAVYQYTLNSASPPPSFTIDNPDGTTSLIWEFPTSVVNQPLPEITYDVLVKPTTPDQSEPQNVAVIASPGDASSEAQRTDAYALLVVNPAGFSVFKSANPVLTRPNEEFGFDLVYANTGTSDFAGVVLIDILPNENVTQTPPTDFDGSATFKSITGSNGETFEFTRRNPALINSDPIHASNQPGGATVWCAAFSGGACPAVEADVTAVRITSPAFVKGQPSRVVNMRMVATGNDANNVYSNRFTARADGLAFAVTSPVASARVRTADVSLTKSVAGPEPSSPETVVFTLTATNAGPHNTASISVLDSLPPGYAYLSHDGGSYDPATGLWSIADVAVNASASLDIVAKVLPGGGYINRAEVTEQSYADPDSEPDNGVLTEDDIADAAILARLEGVLFTDNGLGGGTAHNASIDGTEQRGGFGTIRIETAGGTLLSTAIVNSDGSWSAVLPDGPPEDLTLTVTADPGYRTISETTIGLPGLVNPTSTDGTFVFRPSTATEYTALDMGLIAEPILTQNQSGNVVAGQVLDLPHRYVSTTAGSVTFSLRDEVANPVGAFTTTLFEDVGCDDTPDYALSGARAVVAGETVCLIARTQASAGAGAGSTFTYGIEALTQYQNTALSGLLRNDDSIGTSGEGGGDVVLRKLVTNVTQSTPESVSNMGKIGDLLRYRLILTNPGTAAATDVKVFDATPAYTVLTAAPGMTTVGNVTCSLVTPATVTANYAGPLEWDCPGSFPPGSAGSLTFDVTIAP